MDRQHLLLIFNPKAGKEDFRLNIYEVLERFTRAGFVVTAYPTARARDAYETTLDIGETYDYIISAGGDGTFNEIIDAVMAWEKRPVLGIIPAGTTNDFANTLSLPKDILQASDIILKGKKVSIDVGRFGNDYYSYVAAFGLFTDVPYATSQEMKNILGHTAYMWEGVKRLTSIKSYKCRIELGSGEILEDRFILGMISNARSIAGFTVPVDQHVLLDDGLFEVILVRQPSRITDLQEIISALMGHGGSSKSILTLKASSLRVLSEEELIWTLDGEYGGTTTDVEIQILHKALEIMIPQRK